MTSQQSPVWWPKWLTMVLLLTTTSQTTAVRSATSAANLPYPLLQALQACTHNGPLGMTTGEIRPTQISASSNYPPEWDRGCSEKFARVYQPGDQAWCAKYKSASEWLQVDLGVPAKVTGLMTQGRGEGKEWVQAFLVSYSIDALHWNYITDQYGNQRIFDGNTDSFTVKHYYLDDAIIARFVKFHTVQWNKHPSMRVEIIGCQVCKSPIALPPYGKVQASSERLIAAASRVTVAPSGDVEPTTSGSSSGACAAEDGYIITNTGWCAKQNNDDQWLQFDVGPPTLITGVVTKGRGDGGKKHWVTKYRVSYSNDSRLWHFYKDEQQNDIKEFAGNVDREAERYQYFRSPFIARYIRVHPVVWHRQISMRAGLLGCPYVGECSGGYMRVNDQSPCVENIAFKKESFINNRRQHKRHTNQQHWMHGHASRAVDGVTNGGGNGGGASLQMTPVISGSVSTADGGLHSCTILDNFYVEKPIWMVDVGRMRTVSGLIILTSISGSVTSRDGGSQQDYMHNLDKLTVYVDSKGGREQVDRPDNVCGELTRVNDAIFRPRLHVPCRRPMPGRYIYIEASGVEKRYSRLFGAVLCEVMVYE